jgi:hypothetical protein
VDLKRFIDWLRTAEGLGTAVVAALGVPTAVWAAVTKLLDPVVRKFESSGCPQQHLLSSPFSSLRYSG